MSKHALVDSKDKLETIWHHQLHPSVKRHNAQNGLPHPIRNFIHPTHVTLAQENDDLAWTSRDHRKNRHTYASPISGLKRHGRNFIQKLGHMGRIEYWNISWWVAIAFTLGSIVWVVNGFVVFLPHCNTHFQQSDISSGWTAWLGATIFEAGSIFGMLEAWNRDDVANFGWGVHREFSMDSKTPMKPERRWKWFSSDPKYFRELGFLAAFFQLLAATIFWISGFVLPGCNIGTALILSLVLSWTAIPSIQSAISSHTGLLDGVFWTPQVVGGSGFIISATFIMLEVQKQWYRPEPLSLGWHVGFWNLIGAIGFTLCGALGYAAEVNSGADYQSSLSTFWGGWAFLIGSVIQWYEAVNSL